MNYEDCVPLPEEGMTRHGLDRNKQPTIVVAMKHVGYLGKEAVEGNYDVLREWYSNDISEMAIAHIVEVLGLKSERFPTVKLDDFAHLSFLMRTRQDLR